MYFLDNNRKYQVEDRMSLLEYKVEELDHLVKEHDKLNSVVGKSISHQA